MQNWNNAFHFKKWFMYSFPDYIGNPLSGCRRECESNRDCTSAQECQQFKCVAVCREGGNVNFKPFGPNIAY